MPNICTLLWMRNVLSTLPFLSHTFYFKHSLDSICHLIFLWNGYEGWYATAEGPLTHWDPNKQAVVLHTSFVNKCSWKTEVLCDLAHIIHRDSLTAFQHTQDNALCFNHCLSEPAYS